ncbi:DUF6503 family protein [Reichenbachiella sp. MALMAid0571]|uniref:DUF6503 family protein n=1 Tax=Reichenbachiella sp. MALMAid0571 TaxID=3143939 RepID=UPI0032DE77E6
MKSIIIILLVLGALAACQSPVKQHIPEKETKHFPETFEKGLAAHGGLDKWNTYGTLRFNEISGEDTVLHIIDLKNRNERMEKNGEYKIGFTADSISIYPDENSFPNKNPRFFHNLRFYFFSLPFVTADDGALQEELEPREMDGTTYNRVKITFRDGVGTASKDQYILWFDSESNILKMINFSVTYFNEANAEKYNAIVISKWGNTGGLKVPTEMIGYKWVNDTLGDIRYNKSFDGIAFSTDRPEPDIFLNLE